MRIQRTQYLGSLLDLGFSKNVYTYFYKIKYLYIIKSALWMTVMAMINEYMAKTTISNCTTFQESLMTNWDLIEIIFS